jgi:protease II
LKKWHLSKFFLVKSKILDLLDLKIRYQAFRKEKTLDPILRGDLTRKNTYQELTKKSNHIFQKSIFENNFVYEFRDKYHQKEMRVRSRSNDRKAYKKRSRSNERHRKNRSKSKDTPPPPKRKIVEDKEPSKPLDSYTLYNIILKGK